MIAGLSEEEARDLILSVDTHRIKRRLSPFEVARLFQKAMSHGSSKSDCAKYVKLDTSMISRFLSLLDLSEDIAYLVDWGQKSTSIAFSSAAHLSKLNKDDQVFVASEILSKQLIRREVEQIVQLRQRSGRSIEECVKEIVGMRPTFTKQHVIIGAITDKNLENILETMKQVERNTILESVLKENYKINTRISGSLGTSRFTLITDELGTSAILNSGASDFETVINKALAKRVGLNE